MNQTRTAHQNSVNQAFEFIDENLDGDLSLESISAASYFSPFHFHRIFKFITQETLNGYITRRRVEKSAIALIHKEITVSEIALKYGFNDSSSFTRAFKKFYGVSPTEFKKQHPHKFSKIRQLKSKNGQAYPCTDEYIYHMENLKNWIKMNSKIEVKEMPQMEVAYVSCVGSQDLGVAFDKLIKWATPKGLMHDQTQMMTVYYDSFKFTEASKVRMKACLLLDQKQDVRGEVHLSTIESGRFVVARFEITPEEFEKSWTGLFVWMNENGYKKADMKAYFIPLFNLSAFSVSNLNVE